MRARPSSGGNTVAVFSFFLIRITSQWKGIMAIVPEESKCIYELNKRDMERIAAGCPTVKKKNKKKETYI
jgi:hypothetical protein